MPYDYDSLTKDLEALKADGAQVTTIGYTVLGRPIQCVFKGDLNKNSVLIQAAMHAREYITTPLVIEMMKNYNGDGNVWCVPMVNVDGALLCQYGLDSIPDPALRDFLLEVNGGSTDFTQWKANARAVDLNVNYNADWGGGVQNVTYPSPGNYIGPYPMSEPENAALRDLTLRLQPRVTLSYHAKGQVLFWGYKCILPHYDEAMRISAATGYPIYESADSAGGYKDWYTATTTGLGLTVEVVSPSVPFPIPLDLLPELYGENSSVISIAQDIANNI